MNWNALTDIDLTLVRSIGVDGSATVTAPAGLGGVVSGTPKFGVADTDTRGNSLKFASSIPKAVAKFKDICSGSNPSETNMGLAYWFEGTVKAVDKDSLVGISFTKEFQIVASAGARFGYTLTPVTNTVSADAGGGTSIDYTNRFTIALTPPSPKPLPARVFVVNWPRQQAITPPSPQPPPFEFKKGEQDLLHPQAVPPVADNAAKKPPPESRTASRVRRAAPQPQAQPSARERARTILNSN